MSRKRSRSEDAPAQLADLVPRLEAMPLDASKLEVLVSNALKTAEAALHYAAANASDIHVSSFRKRCCRCSQREHLLAH